MSADPNAFLQRIGESGEGPHDIAHVALMLSALDHPGTSLEPALAHLRQIAETMRAGAGLVHRVTDGAQLLSSLLAGRLGYDGDRMTYDDPQNADLMAVIERRRGLPVALGILYIHAARAVGLRASGLNTRGHFVVRLTHRHDDVAIDPFNGGAVIGSEAHGHAGLAEQVGDIDVLLRLQNNLKIRALEQGARERGLELARRMTLIAPRRADLWFDLGRINEALGVLGAARKAYEVCLALAVAGEALHNEAVLSLSQLKRRLN